MDDQRFDELTKALGAAATRRQAIKRVGGVLAGAFAGAIGLGRADTQAQGGPGGSKCSNQGQSCRAQKCCQGLECIGDLSAGGTNKFCCPSGTRPCNGVCLNLTGDVNNCGSCGNVCPGSTDPCKVAACVNGSCTTVAGNNGAPCEDGDLCTVGDTCQSGVCKPGSVKVCGASNDPCAILVCDPTTGECVPQAANAGAVCREAQGECDLPAFCTGTSTGCPDNPLKEAGTVCREAAGPCDVPEFCTGDSNQCPENEFLPAGTVCLEAQGPCAGPSLCSGDGAQCPENPLLPDTTVCREAAGPCDVPEFCTGDSNQCPENEFLPASTVCREAEGECDVAATCTGNGAQCPDNGFKADGVPCDNDNDLCTLDTCQNGVCRGGQQKTCPASTDPCKVNVCNPATGDCVTLNAPNGIPCEDGDLCTVGDTCQNGTCQAGSPKTCPASTDPCKVNVCVPATGLCVAQNGPNGVPCNDNNLCTVGDTCQNGTCQGGTRKTCPAGQTCVPATGVCQCTTGVTCGNLCCSGNQGTCCPTGTRRAGQCRSNLSACNQ